MSGGVVSRGGVRFEYVADVPQPWRARMRSHVGLGKTMEEALDDLAAQIEGELRVVKAARATK